MNIPTGEEKHFLCCVNQQLLIQTKAETGPGTALTLIASLHGWGHVSCYVYSEWLLHEKHKCMVILKVWS